MSTQEEVLTALGFQTAGDGYSWVATDQYQDIDIVLRARLTGFDMDIDRGLVGVFAVRFYPKTTFEEGVLGTYWHEHEYPEQTISLPMDQITLAPKEKS